MRWKRNVGLPLGDGIQNSSGISKNRKYWMGLVRWQILYFNIWDRNKSVSWKKVLVEGGSEPQPCEIYSRNFKYLWNMSSGSKTFQTFLLHLFENVFCYAKKGGQWDLRRINAIIMVDSFISVKRIGFKIGHNFIQYYHNIHICVH